jgi:hypothetical protein
MKTSIALVASALALLITSSAFAQSAEPAAAPAVMTIAPARPGNTVLPQGTPIRLRTLTQLHSQENRTGDRFDLEVAEDVMLNGVVVIPRGSPATGEITRVKRKGMWGRSGRLETRLLSVRAHGTTIPISGTVAERGETGTAGVVASIVVLPVAGFFVTGTSAVLPVGTGFNGQTTSDLPIAIDPSITAAQATSAPQ